MHFVISCEDKPGALDLRLKVRPEHLEYLKNVGATLAVAGPYLDENDQPVGSLLIVDVADKAAAEAFAAGDPYAKAGLFTSVTVRPWRWTFGLPKA